MENPHFADITPGEVAEAEVASELEKARSFAKTLTKEDIKSGQWFVKLLQMVQQSYDRNARAEYFQQKYPGLPPDEIAEILTSITVKYATIAGAVTGAAATATQITAPSSGGMSLAVMASAIVGEIAYLARIQMQLILDLAVVYDLQLDPDDPEDVLMVFGYAMGVAPVEMVGRRLPSAAREPTRHAIRKYISKGRLKTIQRYSDRIIGRKILQKSIIKYAVLGIPVLMGVSYNYVTTKSLGAIARNHLKNRGKVTEELRQLVSRQNTYDIAFPAAAMYMARIDGEYSAKEAEFYKAILSRMSIEEHTPAEFKKLMADEGNIIQAIAQIEDDEIKSSLAEVLVLMAIYDGELVDEESDFLTKIAAELNVPLDIDDIKRRTADYRAVIAKNVFQKAAGGTKESVTKAAGIAGVAAGNVKGAAATAGGKVSGAFGKVIRHKKDEGPNPETGSSAVICVNCKNEVAVGFRFCPACGQSIDM